jgi:hypothetical protein
LQKLLGLGQNLLVLGVDVATRLSMASFWPATKASAAARMLSARLLQQARCSSSKRIPWCTLGFVHEEVTEGLAASLQMLNQRLGQQLA